MQTEAVLSAKISNPEQTNLQTPERQPVRNRAHQRRLWAIGWNVCASASPLALAMGQVGNAWVNPINASVVDVRTFIDNMIV